MRKNTTRWGFVVLWLACAWSAAATAQPTIARLELIPPSPVTGKINLDIRGAAENVSDRTRIFHMALYLDRESSSTLLNSESHRLEPHTSAGIRHQHPTSDWAGHHRIILVVSSAGQTTRTARPLDVLPATIRSTRTIDGAWIGIVHWSEEEGRPWNAAIRKLTDDDWRQQIRAMHRLGMDTVVIQEVFRNEAYYGRQHIATEGYHGLAYYPSALYPGRISMTAHDPIEAILTQADQLDMHVFLGIGMYAWFDFSPGALTWSRQVAAELWRRYGRHPSFYGWYVSAEAYGNLIPDQGDSDKDNYRRQVIDFFRQFQTYCRALAPEKPVMLAPNTMGLRVSRDAWPLVLQYVDIVCPFGFHRMPPGDLSGEEAAQLWQSMCDRIGSHLWMDMEAFIFDGKALVPRPIEGLLRDLQRFPSFEKILCYQYSGLFNAPEQRITPGGPATVRLYQAYLRYVENIRGAQ